MSAPRPPTQRGASRRPPHATEGLARPSTGRYRYRLYESKDKPYQGDLNTSLPGERGYTHSQPAYTNHNTKTYCTSRRTASAAASIRSRARLLFCPRTPCPPVGPACPDLRVGAGAQRIRKASCRARRQAELPRLSARLARACASRSPRASRICARRLACRAASLIRGSLERASLPLDGVSLRASASTSAHLRLSPA